MRYLLDTVTVSRAFSEHTNPDLVRTIKQYENECAIAAAVWHELYYGCQRLPAGRRRRVLQTYLERIVRIAYPILPYNEACAEWHATERARLAAEGRTVPFADGQIAAVAFVHGLVLITKNTRDFEGFSGLVIEDW